MGILKVLQGIFWGENTTDKMTFYQLYSHLRKWKDRKVYPYDYELPNSISFPPDFWTQVIKMYKHTRSDVRERAISVFWADGDLIFSSVVKGTEKSVTPSNNVRVSYKPSRNKGYYTKEVYVDNNKTTQKEVYKNKIPKNIEVRYLFNLHTHPPHKKENSAIFYTFFSVQDIKSLLASKAVITGMIGNKLWLLVRTSKTPPQVPSDWSDKDMNVANLVDKLGFAVYSGEFKGQLERLHYENGNNHHTSK